MIIYVKQHLNYAEFMKKLSHTGAELKKTLLIKKRALHTLF